MMLIMTLIMMLIMMPRPKVPGVVATPLTKEGCKAPHVISMRNKGIRSLGLKAN